MNAKIITISYLILMLLKPALGNVPEEKVWSYSTESYRLEWDVQSDKARTINLAGGQIIWQGSLLPAFLIKDAKGNKKYVSPTVKTTSIETEDRSIQIIELDFKDYATGELVVKENDWGISFEKLNINWTKEIPEIISMYFGTAIVPEQGKAMMSADDQPFIGNWQAAGYCVPGAKEGPAQSYFRMWDFGQTTIALGNYGPSLGTPYGAAFPRPVLAIAMGNDQGWTIFGAGTIPDAPMLLKIRSTMGCIEYLYREDLWGPGNRERVWNKPLQISFGKNAWSGYRNYFHSFPKRAPLSNIHQKAIWNTWGNWRNKEYPIRPMVDFARQTGTGIFVIDDPWEESQGLGKPGMERFPDFARDMDYIEKSGMEKGIWETLGWIKDTVACQLTHDDLICGKEGQPCKASWNFNPFETGYYCIDISSPKSRAFLKERTIWTMKHIAPKLIKLDFGYGMPSPNMGVPRNPQYRGERYSFELMKIIVEAAKSVDPNVTILYYGINPMYLSLVDMVSLDDQGDLGYAIKEGYDQWSMWASLLSDQQVAVNGSSGYDWNKDDEVVLNSFVLGSPGAVLASHMDDGSAVPEKLLNRRFAINHWFRRSIQWEPLWLNSNLGNLSEPVQLNCWGRIEEMKGSKKLTTLILRGEKDHMFPELNLFEWQGRWAIVSQDDKGISESNELAVVPFDSGFISMHLGHKPFAISLVGIKGEELFTDWEWNNSQLTIRIDEKLLTKTGGFIVRNK